MKLPDNKISDFEPGIDEKRIFGNGNRLKKIKRDAQMREDYRKRNLHSGNDFEENSLPKSELFTVDNDFEEDAQLEAPFGESDPLTGKSQYLLNILGTERIEINLNERNTIQSGTKELKFAQKAKAAKEKLLAAKDKEKSLKQKVMDQLTEVIIARDGALPSISEHDEMVS
ncbi:hypothetical protein AgCh_018452 [Apium graveolens]